MPETPRLLHSLRLQVRWGDMDALGYVNNAEHLRYFEQSRIGWLDYTAGKPVPVPQELRAVLAGES